MKGETIFVGAIGALTTSFFQFLFGEGEIVALAMLLYFLLLLFDFISGYRASKIDDTYASEYGIHGAWRSFCLFFLPALGQLVDRILNLSGPYIFQGYEIHVGPAFGFLVATTGWHVFKSMVANFHRCGWERYLSPGLINWVSSEIKNKEARAAKRIAERDQWLDKGGGV